MSPGEFERAACALLQSTYPGLSAVEGGHDFGRDGDIYFPYPNSGPEARGRLMVTHPSREATFTPEEALAGQSR